jgi:hypothetical protein
MDVTSKWSVVSYLETVLGAFFDAIRPFGAEDNCWKQGPESHIWLDIPKIKKA